MLHLTGRIGPTVERTRSCAEAMAHRRPRVAGALIGTAMLAACAGAPASDQNPDSPNAGFPVTMTNCGHEVTIATEPQRVVTLNQGATEVVLALGRADRLAGTAYLDDSVADVWAERYEKVPVLADEYPSHEQLLSADPDLIYASYGSAFDKEVAGDRAALDEHGVSSYLSSFGCHQEAQRLEPSFEAVWQELRAVARLLGSSDSADNLVSEQRMLLNEILNAAPGDGLTALWYDSGDKTPLVGGGQSGPQLILDAVGARNMFGKVERGWSEGNWEDVLAEDPDVIILADASWSSAEEKREFLESDPVLKALSAVQNKAFVTVPYSEATPGVRLVDGTRRVADQLVSLGLVG